MGEDRMGEDRMGEDRMGEDRMGEDRYATPAEKATRDAFNPPPEPSLWLKDSAVCGDPGCGRPCLTVCPSSVFDWRAGPADSDEVRSKALAQVGRLIAVHHERCLECGACLHLCPRDNIHFEYPAGGYGVYYIRS